MQFQTSNTDGTLSFINRLKQTNMTIQDVEVILRIILTFAALSFIALHECTIILKPKF